MEKYWKPISLTLAALLIALFGILLFRGLGTHAFNGWDEGIYAQVAKESLLNHNQVTLTYFGKPWFEKPPLMIWITELGFTMFGITEFGGRFFIVLFAMATMALTYFFCQQLFKSRLASLLAVASFFLCFQFLDASHFLYFDIPLTFFILLSLYGAIKTEQNPKYYYLFWIGIAAGIMIKDVIGLFPLVIFILWQLTNRTLSFLKNKHFWYGSLMCAALVLPWHIIETLRHGKDFWNIYLGYHVVHRYTSVIENTGPFSYYLMEVLLPQSKPFAFLIVSTFLYVLIKSFSNKHYRLLTVGTLFIFLLFSSAHTIGFLYMMPLYPLLMCMFGIAITDLLKLNPYQYVNIAAVAVLMIIFVGMGIQQINFTKLKLEAFQFNDDNRMIGKFLREKYPATPLYASGYQFAEPSLGYYTGRPIPELPSSIQPPLEETLTLDKMVFHRSTRNLYRLGNYIYICKCGAPYK